MAPIKPALVKLMQLRYAILYRSHQAGLYEFRRSNLLFLVDQPNQRARSSIRLD